MTAARLEAVLRLSYCHGIGPRSGNIFLSRFRDPAAIFTASRDELAAGGVNRRAVAGLTDPTALRDARDEIDLARRRGFTLIPYGAAAYPELLRHLPDPPLVLRVWGDLRRDDQLAVAVVGTRRATAYGRRQAARFTRALAAAGYVIVSGLARGIDGIAHTEALITGTRTVAVLGSGLLSLYPPEHRELAERIARQGAVVSEYPLTEPPQAHNFPRRNRIIAGLSLGVLVVEGGRRSGAIITAGCAAEQGRVVFAVPGQVDSPTAEGVNELVRDGAVLAARIEDILDELPPATQTSKGAEAEAQRPELADNEQRLLTALPLGPVNPEAAAEAAGLALGQAMALLTALELKGYLRRFGDSLERQS